MGDKYVATVRFHMEGMEAELYGRLMEGKKEAGLSVPDYIKQILKEYFENKDRLCKRYSPYRNHGSTVCTVF